MTDLRTDSRQNDSPDPFVELVEKHLLSCIESGRALAADAKVPDRSASRLLIALSGGPDSTALLLALGDLTARLKLNLAACHINHHLRGEESRQDEKFCLDLCRKLGVDLVVLDGTSASPAEDSLRQIRYRMLAEHAARVRAAFIACGHTLNDQIETLLFRLFRGTSAYGLTGMKPCRLLAGSVCLIRPLLSMTRDSCQQFLASRSIKACQDSTNRQSRYTRNYIRNQVIPIISARFPGFQERLERFRQVLQADEDYLDRQTQEAIATQLTQGEDENIWELAVLSELPFAIASRALAMALRSRQVEVTSQRIVDILEACLKAYQAGNKATITLDSRWQLQFSPQSLTFVDGHKERPALPALENLNVILTVPGITVIAPLNQAVRIEQIDCDSEIPGQRRWSPDARGLEVLVDLSAVRQPLTLRLRKAGDVIRPFGMQQTVKLKKYIHTHRPPDWDQHKPLVVIASGSEIIWIPGIGLSEAVRVTGWPTHRLSFLDLAQEQVTIC